MDLIGFFKKCSQCTNCDFNTINEKEIDLKSLDAKQKLSNIPSNDLHKTNIIKTQDHIEDDNDKLSKIINNSNKDYIDTTNKENCYSLNSNDNLICSRTYSPIKTSSKKNKSFKDNDYSINLDAFNKLDLSCNNPKKFNHSNKSILQNTNSNQNPRVTSSSKTVEFNKSILNKYQFSKNINHYNTTNSKIKLNQSNNNYSSKASSFHNTNNNKYEKQRTNSVENETAFQNIRDELIRTDTIEHNFLIKKTDIIQTLSDFGNHKREVYLIMEDVIGNLLGTEVQVKKKNNKKSQEFELSDYSNNCHNDKVNDSKIDASEYEIKKGYLKVGCKSIELIFFNDEENDKPYNKNNSLIYSPNIQTRKNSLNNKSDENTIIFGFLPSKTSVASSNNQLDIFSRPIKARVDHYLNDNDCSKSRQLFKLVYNVPCKLVILF